jgi:hypothetical protein
MAKRLLSLLLIASLCVLGTPRLAQASVSVVDSDVNPDNPGVGTTSTVQLVGVQAGDAICVGEVVEGNQTVSFSDDKGNSYTTMENMLHSVGSPRLIFACDASVAAGTTTITGTLSSGQYRLLFAVAVRSTLGSFALGDSNIAEGDSTTPTSANITVSAAGVVIGFMGTLGTRTISSGSGYTTLEENEDGSDASTGSLQWQASTAGTYAPDWSMSGDARWVAGGVQLDEVSTATCGQRALRGVGC